MGHTQGGQVQSSAATQSLCRAHLFGSRMCLGPAGNKGVKSPLCGSNCHLSQLKLSPKPGSLCSGSFIPGAQPCQSYEWVCSQHVDVLPVCRGTLRAAPTRTAEVLASLLSEPVPVLCHSAGPERLQMQAVPDDAQFAAHRHSHCDPLQLTLALPCITHICLLCYLPTDSHAAHSGVQEPPEERRQHLGQRSLFAG